MRVVVEEARRPIARGAARAKDLAESMAVMVFVCRRKLNELLVIASREEGVV